MVGVGGEASWIEYGNTAGAAAAATTVIKAPPFNTSCHNAELQICRIL